MGWGGRCERSVGRGGVSGCVCVGLGEWEGVSGRGVTEGFLVTGIRPMSLRALNALRALPVYPLFEDKKSNGTGKKSVKRKIA